MISNEEYIERYKKFSNNNLPQMFWDEKRDTREYVFFREGKPRVSNNIYNALEDITWAGFYYPYICKHVTYQIVDDKDKYEVVVGHCHSHDFDQVVEALYYSPESFRIEKEDEEYYSKQELKYLKKVQDYLLFIGVKDVETHKIPASRYHNKKQAKYENASKHSYSDKRIDKILNDECNYCILKWYESYGLERRNYEPGEYRALVTNEKGEYKLYVEYTYNEVKLYKELNEKEKNPEFKDDDRVIVSYFKVLEKF